MAIYQPTNITPDLISGIANGIVWVAVGENVTVSWNVNGTSPLVAYQIDFYTNDAASTPGQSTGKVTLATPFSPVAADGTVSRFSCLVPYSYFGLSQSSASGHTGKFKITQWWGSSDSQKVVQRSLSVYQINRPSSLAIVAGPVGYGGNFTFTGAWTAPNPDYTDTSLLWTRWQAWTIVDYELVTVQDTGKVWGAVSLEWTPYQFAPGDYYVQLYGESSQGEQLYSNVVSFSSMADGTISMSGAISASCDKSMGAVKITLEGEGSIPGYIDGVEADLSNEAIDALMDGLNNMAWTDRNGAAHVAALQAALDEAAVDGTTTDFEPYFEGSLLVLPQGKTAVWEFPAGLTDAPWSFVWYGNAAGISTTGQNLFTIRQTDGTETSLFFDGVHFVFQPTGQQIDVAFNRGDNYLFVLTMGNTAETKTQFTVTLIDFYDGGKQGDDLVLSGYTQAPIASIRLEGGTATENAWVVYGNENSQVLQTALDGNKDREYDNPHVLIPQGGVASISYFGSMTGGSIYRSENGGTFEFFAELAYSETGKYAYYDFGAKNGNSYVYQIINQYGENTQAVAIQTEAVTPCFWEWDLIETAADQYRGNGDYMAINVFRFALNVVSGSDGNGAAPGVYASFTQYPIVMPDTQNRHSGTLTGLIGWLKGPGEYEDSNDAREALRKLSGTRNTLFLRSRRGDLWKIAVSGEISTSVNDNSLKQEITASIPWVEIGPVDGSIGLFWEGPGEGA